MDLPCCKIKMAENRNVEIDESTRGVKRIKVGNEESQNSTESIHSVLNDLSGFQLERVLSDNSQRKIIFIQGSFKDRDGQAILILEKKPFDEESLKGILSTSSQLKRDFSNDVYGNYECSPEIQFNSKNPHYQCFYVTNIGETLEEVAQDFSKSENMTVRTRSIANILVMFKLPTGGDIKATVIHPATEKHIRKYESQPLHIIEETAELYKTVTLPFLHEEQFDLQWVMNIIEHKSEAERIVFEDPDPEIGFILLPDLKWDAKHTENLYLIAIVRKTGILSMRDLNGDHLDLLRNIQTKGTKAIQDKYQISRSQLRIYFHYQPSFYHLHVHFTNLQYDAPGIYAEKSHLLSSVINNLELMPDCYQKATIPFVVTEADNLFLKYEERGLLKLSSTVAITNSQD